MLGDQLQGDVAGDAVLPGAEDLPEAPDAGVLEDRVATVDDLGDTRVRRTERRAVVGAGLVRLLEEAVALGAVTLLGPVGQLIPRIVAPLSPRSRS